MNHNWGWQRLQWLGRALSASLWLVCAAACGDDSSGGDSAGGGAGAGGEPCVTGVVFECLGPGNCDGRRVCRGGFLTSCTCSSGSSAPADAGAMTDASAARPDASSSQPDAGSQEPDAGSMQPDAATPPNDAGSDAGDAATPGVDEDCTNDVDDDGDGAADCADADCTARVCVDSAPAGWDGPVLVYEGQTDAPDCSGAFADAVAEGGTALSAGPANCSACSCSGGPGSCAAALNFETGADSACGGTCTNSVNSSCAELSPSCLSGLSTGYVETHVPAGTGQGCTASAQAPSVPATTWDANARACAPSAALARAGCETGELCAPEPPFAGSFCVMQDGDVACPAGTYTDRRVYFTAIADTRDCSACACGADCDYTWRFFDAADTTCATPLLTLSAANQCVAVTPNGGSIRVGAEIAVPTGACVASGGQPTGSAQPADPITFCCVP